MNDIFMNFASILSLSGKTGGIQSSIAGCSQELRNIALGLELGHGGDSIKEALGVLSNQCDEESFTFHSGYIPILSESRLSS